MLGLPLEPSGGLAGRQSVQAATVKGLGEGLRQALARAQVAAVKGMLVLTLEPNGGLAAVTAASVLQVAVVLRAYEMVRPRRRSAGRNRGFVRYLYSRSKGQGLLLRGFQVMHRRSNSKSGLAKSGLCAQHAQRFVMRGICTRVAVKCQICI